MRFTFFSAFCTAGTPFSKGQFSAWNKPFHLRNDSGLFVSTADLYDMFKERKSPDPCAECCRIGGTCVGRGIDGRGEPTLGQRGTLEIRSWLMVYAVWRQFSWVCWVSEVDARECWKLIDSQTKQWWEVAQVQSNYLNYGQRNVKVLCYKCFFQWQSRQNIDGNKMDSVTSTFFISIHVWKLSAGITLTYW